MIHKMPGRPRVALVSMPWSSAWMPSIQLCVLQQCLSGVAECQSFELYLNYAAKISNSLYRTLSEAGGLVEEWVFANDYFKNEGIDMPDGFLDEMPELGFGSPDVEKNTVSALVDVTSDFLIEMSEEIDWNSFDIVAFSLSIYQTTPSLALARRLKLKYPHLKIIFGGNSCVGPAGRTLLEISPYIDVVAQAEAETMFASLVKTLHSDGDLSQVSSILYRENNSIVDTGHNKVLHEFHRVREKPNYDAFFERFADNQIMNPEHIWLPFESSRGCWWGEKHQCTFCGLHKIMEYRARPAKDVLEELDYLHERYGISRFFATDLIMPMEYYKDFLPELIESRRNYSFFYELKANVKWQEVALLSEAGVKEAQPGLESLSSSVLRTMRKGQTGAKVIQFLKWSQEFDIDVQWNIIIGTPGEDPNENEISAKKSQDLWHLKAPRLIHFELDRFSPIYENPEEFGLSNLKPLYIYKYIYPISESQLSNLVYRFEYDQKEWNGPPPWLSGQGDAYEYPKNYSTAVQKWHVEKARNARFEIGLSSDNNVILTDSRYSTNDMIIEFSRDVSTLFLFFENIQNRDFYVDRFKSEHHDVYDRLGGKVGIEKYIEQWVKNRYLFEDEERLVTLPVWNPPRKRPEFLTAAIQFPAKREPKTPKRIPVSSTLLS